MSITEAMSTTANVVPIKQSLADEVRGKIALAATRATPADHQFVNDLIAKAKNAKFSTEMITLTPGAAALLFLNWNSHNRPWSASLTVEYSRRMKEGLWKQNSMSGGFYDDGLIEDMQHRLGGAALAEYTLTLPIVFGVAKGAVDTIDGGKRRSGADAAALDGIDNAARKQQIVRQAAAYLIKCGDTAAALKSETEVKTSIETNNDMLDQAIDIGEKSKAGITNPVLKEATAEMLAYLLLKHGWPLQRIREKLALFQTGVSTVGENDPYYVAANFIDARRKRAARGEKMTTSKELAIAIYVMVEAEKGVRAMQAKHVKAAADGKVAPSPMYPDVEPMAAAS